VGAIISKLPSPWNDYKQKLLHMQEDFTVEKIMRHLRIEEETPKRDASDFPNSSNVNYVNKKPKKNTRGMNPRVVTIIKIRMTRKTIVSAMAVTKKGTTQRIVILPGN